MVACQSAYLVLEKNIPAACPCTDTADILVIASASNQVLASVLSLNPKHEYTLPLMSLECFEDGVDLLSDVGSGPSKHRQRRKT